MTPISKGSAIHKFGENRHVDFVDFKGVVPRVGRKKIDI
jgi:hypothetical protein